MSNLGTNANLPIFILSKSIGQPAALCVNDTGNHSATRTNIHNLIAHPESVDQARAALAEHFGAFTLEPVTQAGKTTYLAHGKVDFFGDEAMARTDGAGGQNRTGYARLFRAALYQ